MITATLPAYTVRSLVNFLQKEGLTREQLLEQLHSSDDVLNDPEQTIELQSYESLLRFGAEALGLANIGFQFGKQFELSVWGMLGFIVAVAPDLKQTLALQKRYQCLLGNSGLAYHENQDGIVTMRWLSECCSSAHSVEQVITAWLAFAFRHTDAPEAPLSVHFTHSVLTQASEYEAFFRCPVYFNAEFNGVKLKAQHLQLPVRTSNSEVLNVLCCHAEQCLAKKRSDASLDVVRQYIIEVLPDHVPTLTEVADYLGISSRQLQRKFQANNASLTQFLDQVRLSLAVSYLTQTEYKLLYIAQLLGYSEQSAFQRAFKRRYGVTPGEYRLHPFAFSLSS